MTAAAPVPRPKTVLCPYCGHLSLNPFRCEQCKGLFDPLSRQASQNSMGPWFVRDPVNPFRPGCSFDTLRQLIQRRKVTAQSVIRGPTTRQFWVQARWVPCVANLLGECHACHTPAKPDDPACSRCGASFTAVADREFLGLAPVHLLPGSAAPEAIADASVAVPDGRPTTADDLRAAMPLAAPPDFPVLASAVSAGENSDMLRTGVAGGPSIGAASGAQNEIALARLQRRAARQTALLWILAAALLIAVAFAILALVGPSFGFNLIPSGRPASAIGTAAPDGLHAGEARGVAPIDLPPPALTDSPSTPRPPTPTGAQQSNTPSISPVDALTWTVGHPPAKLPDSPPAAAA